MAENAQIREFRRLSTVHHGLGTADTTGSEWQETLKQDTLASYVSHSAVLTDISLEWNSDPTRARSILLQRIAESKARVASVNGRADVTEPVTTTPQED